MYKNKILLLTAQRQLNVKNMIFDLYNEKIYLWNPKVVMRFVLSSRYMFDVFGPLPATRGTAEAKQRREKESHRRQREAWGTRLFLKCPSYEWNNMGGEIIPAQIWIEQERGHCLPLAICPPPPPSQIPPAEPQG